MLSDINVEDIIINGLKPIYIHHAQEGFISTGRQFNTRKELDHFIQKLLVFAGRRDFDKIINLELPNLAGRVNIIKALRFAAVYYESEGRPDQCRQYQFMD